MLMPCFPAQVAEGGDAAHEAANRAALAAQAGGARDSSRAADDSDTDSAVDVEDVIATLTPEVCPSSRTLYVHAKPSSPSLRALRRRHALLLRMACTLLHQHARSVISDFAGLAWAAPATWLTHTVRCICPPARFALPGCGAGRAASDCTLASHVLTCWWCAGAGEVPGHADQRARVRPDMWHVHWHALTLCGRALCLVCPTAALGTAALVAHYPVVVSVHPALAGRAQAGAGRRAAAKGPGTDRRGGHGRRGWPRRQAHEGAEAVRQTQGPLSS